MICLSATVQRGAAIGTGPAAAGDDEAEADDIRSGMRTSATGKRDDFAVTEDGNVAATGADTPRGRGAALL